MRLLWALLLWSLAIGALPLAANSQDPVLTMMALRVLFGFTSGVALPSATTVIAQWSLPSSLSSSSSSSSVVVIVFSSSLLVAIRQACNRNWDCHGHVPRTEHGQNITMHDNDDDTDDQKEVQTQIRQRSETEQRWFFISFHSTPIPFTLFL